uniref:Response regulator receiver protein n=1 Tax=uncultured delta proteobacterium TaxID=34034 RepID=H5SLN8_9DELT|nr:response regulator receiver protein [uncultured delta proteobacterium]
MSRGDNHRFGLPGISSVRRPFSSGNDPTYNQARLAALSKQYGVPAIDLTRISFPLSNLDLIPLEIARRHKVLPVQVREDTLVLAMAEPDQQRVIEELEFVSGKRVLAHVADPDVLAYTIDRAYEARDRGETIYTAPHDGASLEGSGLSLEPSDTEEDAFAPSDEVTDRIDLRRPSVDDYGDATFRSTGTSTAATSRVPGPTLDSVFSPLETVRGNRVLVVDDDEDIRKLLRRVLEERGYQVLEADRGSVALAMIRDHIPDAIVLDAMLPELHGFDICRRIKSSAHYGHIPILMISAVYRGWRFAEDLKNAYGVTAYIEKPFRIADILAAVDAMLSGAPKSDGRDPEALSEEASAALTAGMEAYRRGDLDAAIEHLQRGIALDPSSYRLHYHLGLLVARRGDIFHAIQELETAVEINPRSFAALKNLAVLYQQAGFKHKAIEMWERAIAQSPDHETRGQIKEHLMSLL